MSARAHVTKSTTSNIATNTATDSLRVRMYRQGLGDCFLITVTTAGVVRHALIDCGLVSGSPDADQRMTRVAQDIHDTTGGHLDVLAATHEHWDHISGFVQAPEVFATITIGEVWLAWTENPKDPDAAKLLAARNRSIRALTGAANALQASGSPQADRLLELLGFYGDRGVAGGGPTTADAMAWLKARPVVRFLSPSQTFEALGIRVFVLGPPRDPALIHRSDPGATAGEVYTFAGNPRLEGFLTATEALSPAGTPGAPPPGDDLQPFDAFFRLDKATAAKHPVIRKDYLDPALDWRRIDQDWLGSADVLALNLDGDTNNTSLVLAFGLPDGSVLLFPGDAQVGSWLSWQTVSWTTDSGTLTGPELLARTRLYKVGHHGSHNATLRAQGLELMKSPDLVAMISVNRVTAHKKQWDHMPLPGLIDALKQRTSGRLLDAELGSPVSNAAALPDATWQSFVTRTDVQDLWVDHTITWPAPR